MSLARCLVTIVHLSHNDRYISPIVIILVLLHVTVCKRYTSTWHVSQPITASNQPAAHAPWTRVAVWRPLPRGASANRSNCDPQIEYMRTVDRYITKLGYTDVKCLLIINLQLRNSLQSDCIAYYWWIKLLNLYGAWRLEQLLQLIAYIHTANSFLKSVVNCQCHYSVDSVRAAGKLPRMGLEQGGFGWI